jgi:hypothetical protein
MPLSGGSRNYRDGGGTVLRLLMVQGAALLAALFLSHAQQIHGTVQVNTSALPPGIVNHLKSFQTDISSYVNTWGEGPRKIPCTLQVVFVSGNEQSHYRARLFLGTDRRIDSSIRHTTILRLIEPAWEFDYVPGRPLPHSPFEFDDLTGLLDFYLEVSTGADADTRTALGGTPFYQKAADIAALGRAAGKSGWNPEMESFNRGRLIDDLLSVNSVPVRKAIWLYHTAGLDSLEAGRERAQTNIWRALRIMGKANRELDPGNLVMKLFFEAKYEELASVLADFSGGDVFAFLARLDPDHRSAYDAASVQGR